MTLALVDNLADGESVATTVRVADGERTRMRGRVGSEPLRDGEGLLLVPCGSDTYPLHELSY